MDEKYIVDIKGKKFITYAGLLNEATEKGLIRFEVKDLNVDWEKKSAVCLMKATFTSGKIFEGVGSGTKDNCAISTK